MSSGRSALTPDESDDPDDSSTTPDDSYGTGPLLGALAQSEGSGLCAIVLRHLLAAIRSFGVGELMAWQAGIFASGRRKLEGGVM